MRILLRTLLFLTLTAPAFAQTPVAPKDLAGINATLAAMDRAWAAHDMDAWTANMTDDVEWINVVGMWWRGKPEVLHAHKVMFAKSFMDTKFTTDNRVVEQVSPGVALVTDTLTHDAFPTPGGHMMPAGQDRLTQLFVRQSDGRWLLRSGHNTPIVAGTHDPAKAP